MENAGLKTNREKVMGFEVCVRGISKAECADRKVSWWIGLDTSTLKDIGCIATVVIYGWAIEIYGAS